MKTKSRKKRARACPPPTDKALALLGEINSKLTFLCEAKDREEVRSERQNTWVKKMIQVMITHGAKTGILPSGYASVLQSYFSNENKN